MKTIEVEVSYTSKHFLNRTIEVPDDFTDFDKQDLVDKFFEEANEDFDQDADYHEKGHCFYSDHVEEGRKPEYKLENGEFIKL